MNTVFNVLFIKTKYISHQIGVFESFFRCILQLQYNIIQFNSFPDSAKFPYSQSFYPYNAFFPLKKNIHALK